MVHGLVVNLTTWRPGPNWVAQVSPDESKGQVFHADDGYEPLPLCTTPVRYVVVDWSTSLIWARNYKTVGRYGTNSARETVTPITRNNLITGRFEGPSGTSCSSTTTISRMMLRADR
jgi:hypothetical protein